MLTYNAKCIMIYILKWFNYKWFVNFVIVPEASVVNLSLFDDAPKFY